MAATEFLARDYTFDLNTGTVGVPVWTSVHNIKTWTHSPKSNNADTTTFDDDGRMTHMKASRGDSFSLEGLALEDPDTGDRDAGQEACEAWAQEVGPSSLKQFRITSPAGNTLTFEASAEVTLGGGGTDDPSTWKLDLEVSGSIS